MKKKLCSLLIALIVIGTSVVLPFTVTADIAPLAPEEFFNDFEGMEVGEGYTAVQVEELTGVPVEFNKPDPSSNITASIIEEEDGNKVIKFVSALSGETVISRYTLAQPLSAGQVEMSFEFMPASGGAGAWSLFYIHNATGTTKVISWMNRWYKTDDAMEGEMLTNPRTNEKGRYELRAVVSRTSSDEKWDIKVYDDSAAEPLLCFQGKSAENFGEIVSVRPFYLYASPGGWPATFDNYSVKVTYFPAVLSENDGLKGAEPDAPQMTVGFSGALPNPTDEVTIVKKDNPDVVIKTTTVYDSATGELTLTPESYLEYDTDYKLLFKSGGVMNHVFTTAAAPLTLVSKSFSYTPSEGSAQESIPSEGIFDATCTVEIDNNTTDRQTYEIVLVAYNCKGAAVKTQIFEKTILRDRVATASATLSGLDAAKVTSVKALVVKEADGVGYREIPSN